MKQTSFSKTLTRYFTENLTISRNLSPNTVSSYRDAFKLLLLFMQDVNKLSPEQIEFDVLNSETIISFLNWLEDIRNVSIETRNQRLAAMHAFFRYAQYQRPDLLSEFQQILKIPKKKHSKKIVCYLSDTQLNSLFQQPNSSLFSERRDLSLMTFLYDSGARVQELIDLNVRDIRLDYPYRVILTGKGRKSRQVPLMTKTVKLMEQYLNDRNLIKSQYLDTPIFFNNRHERLTRAGVTYILKKYASKTNGIIKPSEISPHILRHTKAMHLLHSGINLIYIRDFLGHVDISTTEIYARASDQMKRSAFEKVVPNYSVDEPMPWETDKNLLQWLNSFGKRTY
jgi:integrase/recombinase XerD